MMSFRSIVKKLRAFEEAARAHQSKFNKPSLTQEKIEIDYEMAHYDIWEAIAELYRQARTRNRKRKKSQ